MNKRYKKNNKKNDLHVGKQILCSQSDAQDQGNEGETVSFYESTEISHTDVNVICDQTENDGSVHLPTDENVQSLLSQISRVTSIEKTARLFSVIDQNIKNPGLAIPSDLNESLHTQGHFVEDLHVQVDCLLSKMDDPTQMNSIDDEQGVLESKRGQSQEANMN
eukprot:CAMPEP_0113299542 /NCGR_PEP_ID=MMETSP0010_2-20120614/1537_1 /TAXON_ID=216773 ORGANISM="Corethron hystrix, Strain 308" /NCGR_SAMPLE_ID=MMETSP0010_2 /ASSEMBLY_ACC=CAM_ASM_000155 /LENGTH=163 /DNA_ID=CAMNT_0000152801 /DNA_START=179 /DNA_END=670 /DNA_ORIENTATION=- /assembly_acc=CAM_ASM_000155